MSSLLIATLIISIFSQSKPAERSAPRIGDAAPPLHVSTWIPNAPPALPGPQVEGREAIVVMHFWATSEAASRRAIPHLAQLHADYGKRGVVVIALSNEEPEVVTAVAGRLKLPYFVAADEDNGTTETWLAGISAFPWTYVVDRTGRILWRGDSMWELREVVADALAGRFDLAAAQQRAQADARAEELAALCLSLPTPDPKAILRAADKVIAADPARTAGYQFKRKLLLRMPDGATKLAKLHESMRSALWNRPSGLHALLTWQWDEATLKHRDPALLLRCAERIVELTQREDPFALAELARVQHELGRHDAAIESQAKAAELIKFDPDGQYDALLDYYRRVKSAAAPATAPVQ